VVKKTSKKSSKKTSKKSLKLDFESSLQELESIVERMEEGEQSLEQSLVDFERGVALTRTCQQALKHAEQKVQTLIQQSEEAELVPFDDEQD